MIGKKHHHLFRQACLLFAFYLATGVSSRAQEIDNTATYRDISSSYVRLSVDNDYFVGTDDQYTGGANVEICMPWVSKFPLTKLAFSPYGDTRYGIGLEEELYTPENLADDGIQQTDRPFAATFYLKTFSISLDTSRKQRFTTTLCMGVIGPTAMGSIIQDGIHVLTCDVQPPGWKYQVHNDVVLNYWCPGKIKSMKKEA